VRAPCCAPAPWGPCSTRAASPSTPGADCIETNTFGANRFKLAAHGLDGQVREINRRGVALARDVRESAGRDVFVLGRFEVVAEVLDAIR